MRQAPWVKIPTDLYCKFQVGTLGGYAFRLLICVFCMTAGNASAGVGIHELLWESRLDRSALDECIAAGVLALTEQGTVTLTGLVLPMETCSARGSESTNPSTERSRRRRAKIAAEKAAMQAMPQLTGLLVEVTPSASPPVPVQPTPATRPQEVAPLKLVDDTPTPQAKTTLASAAHAALIFPDTLTPAVQKSIQQILSVSGVTHEQAQIVLDEMAGNFREGKVIHTPPGWARMAAGKILAGNFFPEYADAIAEQREMAAKMVRRQQELVASTPVLSIEEVRDQIAKNPDPRMRAFLLERLENIGKIQKVA